MGKACLVGTPVSCNDRTAAVTDMLAKLLLSIVTNLFNLISVLIAFPTLCIFLLWKLLVVGIAFVKWKGKVTLMRGQDAMYTLRPNGAMKNSTVLAWLVMDGVVTKDEVVRMVENNAVHSRDAEVRTIYR